MLTKSHGRNHNNHQIITHLIKQKVNIFQWFSTTNHSKHRNITQITPSNTRHSYYVTDITKIDDLQNDYREIIIDLIWSQRSFYTVPRHLINFYRTEFIQLIWSQMSRLNTKIFHDSRTWHLNALSSMWHRYFFMLSSSKKAIFSDLWVRRHFLFLVQIFIGRRE